jgi:hypothetical protein
MRAYGREEKERSAIAIASSARKKRDRASTIVIDL